MIQGMEFEESGLHQEAPGFLNKIPPYDSRSGNHYWILPLIHHVTDPEAHFREMQHLDLETLVLVAGIGCYYCEQPYSKRLLHRRCPGEPRSQ